MGCDVDVDIKRENLVCDISNSLNSYSKIKFNDINKSEYNIKFKDDNTIIYLSRVNTLIECYNEY